MNEQDARTYLDIGITPNEVVRLRWPAISEERASHLLWEHTPYPMVDGLLDIVEAVAEFGNEGCGCPSNRYWTLDTGSSRVIG